MAKQEMTWNSNEEAYFGVTSDGQTIRVEGVEMAECRQDVENGEFENETWREGELSELLDPDTWQSCVGANQNVEYVK